MAGIGKYKKRKKGKRGFRMKSPLRVDLTKKTGLGPRTDEAMSKQFPQGEDANYEALNDMCMKKGMVYSMEEGTCVKKGSTAKDYKKGYYGA